MASFYLLRILPTVIVFSVCSTICADTIVFDAIADNTIYQDNPGNSNGAGDFLFAGRNGEGSARRGLIGFDLSGIPSNAIVEQVTITLFMSQTGAGDTQVNFHRLLSDWGESTSDAPGGEGGGTAAAVGDATWDNNFFPDSFWAVAGGDFVGMPSASTIVGGVGSYSWDSPLLVSDVQGWLNGDFSNFGWAIVGDESTFPTTKRFNSRSNSANNPFLTVTFSVVPEPGCSGLALIFLLRHSLSRKRRGPESSGHQRSLIVRI